ncbi:MAG: hypothetical protein H6711_15355 [Myxococcales bacterium]|nr:hypothetical protein [Myxococcales bacterium]
MPRTLAALPLLLLAACAPTGGADMQQVVETMVEVKVEMRMAIDELRQARDDLQGARAEIDRARFDLDEARRALDRARKELDLEEPTSRPSLDRRLPADVEAGITCTDEAECTIKRPTLDGLLANPALLAKQARIVSAVRDGDHRGYKLYGIRTGSLPKLLGLKNGDLVTAVNGTRLDSMDRAMELFGSLGKAQKIDLELERKGEPIALRITIDGSGGSSAARPPRRAPEE